MFDEEKNQKNIGTKDTFKPVSIDQLSTNQKFDVGMSH